MPPPLLTVIIMGPLQYAAPGAHPRQHKWQSAKLLSCFYQPKPRRQRRRREICHLTTKSSVAHVDWQHSGGQREDVWQRSFQRQRVPVGGVTAATAAVRGTQLQTAGMLLWQSTFFSSCPFQFGFPFSFSLTQPKMIPLTLNLLVMYSHRSFC